ncbi:hypothetical protein AU15_16510 [Marinobacter salarius]|uniref:Uncharacterized protein n=1 Tax=Marinobacter salarius TaxID=1420917 RepID=W5YWQ2_9GAMM|nr:hypothetical protein AU15_16510 [Marinobacter salarius]
MVTSGVAFRKFNQRRHGDVFSIAASLHSKAAHAAGVMHMVLINA